MPGRLREDGGVSGSATAPCGAAPAVEHHQLESRVARDVRERDLCAVDVPLRGEIAAVLGGVRVTDHHLETAASAVAHEVRVPWMGEHRADRVGRRVEVLDRLEQRHGREVRAGSVDELQGTRDVVDAGRAADDERVAGAGAVATLLVGDGLERRPDLPAGAG